MSLTRQLLTGILLSVIAISAMAQEEASKLCAEVKIEIAQELTIERQGFEAIMKITNSLDAFAIEDIVVTVNFADANGDTVEATSNTQSTTASFFIRVDDTRGVAGMTEGANGTISNGSIAANSVGEMRWLIIPTEKAANDPAGSLYFIGATLSYQFGGKQETVIVAPDTIIVKPQPNLILDYFLTEEVIGDDAFTAEIEPPVPYTLGVRVVNNGLGEATQVKIESAQPTIVENKENLLVGFTITESYKNNQSAEKTLLIDFGHIPSHSISTGRWVMETTLSGKFTSIDTRFSHADEFGGALTSLITATNSYFLVHDVRVDRPGRDAVRDYLAKTQAGTYRVFESETTGADLATCVACADVGEAIVSMTGNLPVMTLNVSGIHAGLNYLKVQITDTTAFAGKAISQAVRGDGKALLLENVWISQERNENDVEVFDYFINIFDAEPTATYTLVFDETSNLALPPFIGLISDRNTTEGGQVGFLVQAYDPNGTIPALSALNLPTGAKLELSASNKGVFSWFPKVGQSGLYPLVFRATDGQLSFDRIVNVRVSGADDHDGDGMDDDWEQQYFGNTNRDGSGDFDGDGLTDLEEFELGTDPTQQETAPPVPEIASPLFNSVILQGANPAMPTEMLPTLTLVNSKHNIGMTVHYQFEVFADIAMTQQVALVDEVTEGSGAGTADQTQLVLTVEQLNTDETFTDNKTYIWRARAYTVDGQSQRVYSDWVTSQFFINTANDAPSAPILSSPLHEATVPSLKPLLSIDNATDIDGDAISYDFALYAQGHTEPLASVYNLVQNYTGQTIWQVSKLLTEDTFYEWQVTAHDGRGLSATSVRNQFLVSLVNGSPTGLAVVSPLNGSEVNSLEANQSTWLSVLNATDAEKNPLSYWFEVDTINTFDSANNRVLGPVVENANTVAAGTTRVLLDALVEDQRYFWRVRAHDGTSDSSWVQANFLVSEINSAPNVPTIVSPGNQSTIETLLPAFTVAPAIDSEGHAISYRFELYDDAQLQTQLGLFVDAQPTWALESALEDNRDYYWRVRAEDQYGAASGWQVASFTTDNNGIDDAPTISFVAPASDLSLGGGMVTVQWQDADPDSSATISLYAVNSQNVEIQLVSGLNEDADGIADIYTFDAAILPIETYHLRLKIADDTSEVIVTSTHTLQRLMDTDLVSAVVTGSDLDEAGINEVWIDVSLTQPLNVGDSVTVNFQINDNSESKVVSAGGVVGVNYLQFTNAAVSGTVLPASQRIILKGLDDCEIDGDQSVSLLFTSINANVAAYDGVSLEAVSLLVTDNEYLGQSLFICGYDAVSQQVVSGESRIDYVLKPRLQNRGVSLTSAQASVTVLTGSDPVQQIMGNSIVNFADNGGVLSPASVESIVVRADAATGLDTAKLDWQITAGAAAVLTEGTSNNNSIIGTPGNDVIDGGAGHDTIYAGAGDDRIIGGPGSDSLYGEAGNDIFEITGSDTGVDLFNGGDGYDIILGGNGDDVVRISSFSGDNTVEEINGGNGINIIAGSTYNNTLDFSNTVLINIDSIQGQAGHDTIKGSAGNDTIIGGAGNDTLYGNDGNDTFVITGENDGTDIVYGGNGNDKVLGSSSNDTFSFSTFSGAATVEQIDGQGGVNKIVGNGNNNILDFSSTLLVNIASIDGGAGHDTIMGSAQDDVIIGGAGNDILYGNDGNDTFQLLAGNNGIDTYYGGTGIDTIKGSSGDDDIAFTTFSAGSDIEIIDGDGGLNTIQGSGNNDSLDFTGMTLINIAELNGMAGNDTIRGTEQADVIVGGSGNDTLYGNGGDDTFKISADDTGIDTYYGGEGIDTIDGNLAVGAIRIPAMNSSYSIEVIDAGTTPKIIEGSNNNDSLDFTGMTLINIAELNGMAGNDTIRGTEQADVIVGGNGNDTLYGNGGDDTFKISADDTGIDIYYGGEGIDTIDGSLAVGAIRIPAMNSSYSIEVIDAGTTPKIIEGSSNNDSLDFTGMTLINIAELNGMAGNDTIRGTEQADVIVGGNGNDTLYGNGGDDTFKISADDTGIDIYYGGEGIDTIDGSLAVGAIRMPAMNSSYSIEVIDAGTSPKIIEGSSSNNSLDFTGVTLINIAELNGMAGNDTIRGTEQADVIVGGNGNDTLYGNGGDDTFKISADDTGIDTYYGGEGIDTIDGSLAVSAIRIPAMGSAHSIEVIDGGNTSKNIEGSGSNNLLDFQGVTLIYIDRLHGMAGHDTIHGNDQANSIVGGTGNDMLYGHGGNDLYEFEAGSGADTVDDSEGINSLSLVGLSDAAGLWFRVSGNNIIVYRLGTSDSITLLNAVTHSSSYVVTSDLIPVSSLTGQNLLDYAGQLSAMATVTNGVVTLTVEQQATRESLIGQYW